MDLIDQLKSFKNNPHSRSINPFIVIAQCAGKSEKTNTYYRIIQDIRARNLDLKSKKMLTVAEDTMGRRLWKEVRE